VNPVDPSTLTAALAEANLAVLVSALLEHGFSTMECREGVHDEYNARVDAEHEHLVWRHPRVHSYSNNEAGRVTTNMPWKLHEYWRMTREPALADFVVRPV
jgi:4-hydroxyacetophenone monooxygenase